MADDQKTVLIVEDDNATLLALSHGLTNAGFKTTSALDGKLGLAAALSTHPDLILTDLNMPNMNGIEMIRELRKDEWGKTAKIIIITSMNNMETIVEAGELGAFFYNVKTETPMANIVSEVRLRINSVQ